MFGLLGKKELIFSIDDGQIVELSQVPDEMFSNKMVGDGFAIIPKTGEIKSPVKGEIIQVFPTGHAVGIKSVEGTEILIHIGIDTVELKGQGFDALVKVGDRVDAGQAIIRVDLEYVLERGKSIVTPIIFTDKKTYKEFRVNYKVVDSGAKIGYIKS